MRDLIGYLAGEKQPEETTQCPKCKEYFYDYDWQQHDCESNRVELPVILIKRKFWKKLFLAPEHFRKQLAIGKPRIKFIYRLSSAWHLTIFMLRKF